MQEGRNCLQVSKKVGKEVSNQLLKQSAPYTTERICFLHDWKEFAPLCGQNWKEGKAYLYWYYELTSDQALCMTTMTKTMHFIFAMISVVINGPTLQNQMIGIAAHSVTAQVWTV